MFLYLMKYKKMLFWKINVCKSQMSTFLLTQMQQSKNKHQRPNLHVKKSRVPKAFAQYCTSACWLNAIPLPHLHPGIHPRHTREWTENAAPAMFCAIIPPVLSARSYLGSTQYHASMVNFAEVKVVPFKCPLGVKSCPEANRVPCHWATIAATWQGADKTAIRWPWGTS